MRPGERAEDVRGGREALEAAAEEREVVGGVEVDVGCDGDGGRGVEGLASGALQHAGCDKDETRVRGMVGSWGLGWFSLQRLFKVWGFRSACQIITVWLIALCVCTWNTNAYTKPQSRPKLLVRGI